MTWVPWLIGLAIVVVGVPVLGALGVGALAFGTRLLLGPLQTKQTSEESTN